MKWSRTYPGRTTKPTGAVLRRVLNAVSMGETVKRGAAASRLIALGFVDIDNRGDYWITPRGRVALAEEWTREEA